MTEPSPARPARCRRMPLSALALCGASLASAPAIAEGVEAFNGNWVGAAIADGPAEWPAMEAEAVEVAIDGNSSEFQAEWTGFDLDNGAIYWREADADFERADRAGYYAPDDGAADILDGEPQLWAFSSDAVLVLGRLQIDEDSGKYVISTCRLVRTDAGLDATLTLSTSDAPAMSAVVTMVRR